MSRNTTNDNMFKAAIYCRVAMYNKVNTVVNESVIADQEAICRAYADSNGYQIESIFTDFASGLTLERE